MTQELEKNKPTLLNYNGEWGLIPKGSISNFEELEGPDAVAQALRTQGSSHVRDLKLDVHNVIQSMLAKDPCLEWAWCIEISTQTLTEVREGKQTGSAFTFISLCFLLWEGCCTVCLT